MESIICPRCSGNISDERMSEVVIICPHCGWTHSELEVNAQGSMQKNISLSMFMICAMLVASFVMVVNWDKYSVKIVPLKVKQWTNSASIDDLNAIATICKDRGKPTCMEEAYADILAIDESNLEAMSEYGKILVVNGKIDESIKVYIIYFKDKKNRKNADVAYDFAKVLADAGRVKEAVKFYELALRGKPGILQVTVLRNYVEFLIENNEFKRARRVILKTQRLGLNSRSFMKKELSEITKKLRSA